ncbi:uncharacterized protein LOC114477406 [Gouania willdenowi]|uniref:uncharacterized protein LOC114477406 n=1 Tax=Gouania willdenowi TaxID=441366 RepID=UPI0010569DC0|nr:uncharacterized protein LOC114477406 [Gouania willdenowi]
MTLGHRSSLRQAAVGFALGAVGGCILGATEEPVDMTNKAMTAPILLKPLVDEITSVGPLGLGTLMGATALTTATTSIMAGVILAAVVAAVFVATRSCSLNPKQSIGLWASAGLAGTCGTTLSGATFGTVIQWIVSNYNMVGLLCALSIFTLLKPPMQFVFQRLWKQGESLCTVSSHNLAKEREELEVLGYQQRQKEHVDVEKRILTLENGGKNQPDDREMWSTRQKQREAIERRKMENEEAETEQRSIHDWISTVLVKQVDFLAFSGIPMAVTALVTTCFGLLGYGAHQSVLIVLLVLVAVMGYFLLKSSDFTYWMLIGCMGMMATFVVAMLTLNAGQEALALATKMKAAGQINSHRTIEARVKYYSCLEALSASFFATKLCQLGLGASVGGALVRRNAGEVKVIVGAAFVTGCLLAGVNVLSLVVGAGGRAGALLGVVAAAGVSVGGGGSSSKEVLLLGRVCRDIHRAACWSFGNGKMAYCKRGTAASSGLCLCND